MTRRSQNGWPVDVDGSRQDRGDIYPGVRVPNGVRAGSVAVIFRYIARRFHDTVRPLKAGSCWGWYVKPIEGTQTESNHSSGTAIDLNADQLPMGDPATEHMSQREIAACMAIVLFCDGTVRWGGTYKGRPDPMHWEIVGDEQEAAALADKITDLEDNEMRPLTQADADLIVDTLMARVVKTGSGTSTVAYGSLNGVLATLMARTDVLANRYHLSEIQPAQLTAADKLDDIEISIQALATAVGRIETGTPKPDVL